MSDPYKKRVFVDTTVLTDALLKQNPLGDSARNALNLCSEAIVPVYAIKEFKAGPLNYYVWLHNKLLGTKSLQKTINGIKDLVKTQPNRVSTALEALGDLFSKGSPGRMSDEEQADLLRSSLARTIFSAWRKRRKVSSRILVSEELSCYSEAEPILSLRTGRIENPRALCKLQEQEECCLAKSLKGRPSDLKALLKAIEGRTGNEHTKRRDILHKLSNTPKRTMDARDCARLGDAYFALSAPPDTSILTTNLKDHVQLAKALGKTAISPEQMNSTPLTMGEEQQD